MKKSACTLLVLLLSVFSIKAPCHAQTVAETQEVKNESSTENILSNDNANERSILNSLAESATAKSTIISENSENKTAVNNTQINPKPTVRSRIPCRFYSAPSMQQ